jgi:hypothetical protein
LDIEEKDLTFSCTSVLKSQPPLYLFLRATSSRPNVADQQQQQGREQQQFKSQKQPTLRNNLSINFNVKAIFYTN